MRTPKRLEALSQSMGHAIQLNFFKGIKAFKKRVSAPALLEAWKKGDYQDLMRIIPWNDLPEDLSGMKEPFKQDMKFATDFAISGLPAPSKPLFRYDTKNPKLDRFIEARTATLVTRVSDNTRTIISNAVRRSFNEAGTPRDVSREIRDSIGLLPQHEIAVHNLHSGLLAKGMSPDKAQVMADTYTDKLLDYRATMIGRTESAFAKNYGQLYVWQQAGSENLLPEGSLKVWNNTGPEPCEDCVEMDGVSIGLFEFWNTPDGQSVEVPNEIHPHCNCIMTLEMDGQGEAKPEEE